MHRRSDDILNDKCLCGSSKLTKDCCARPEGVVFKEPIKLKEKSDIAPHANRKCIFGYRETCSHKISREHFISQSVLRLLNNPRLTNLKLKGFLGQDDFKSYGIKSLTTKILCKKHNEMFSTIDKEAARFVRAIQSHLEHGPDKEHLFSGYDIERWLFKVSIGLLGAKVFPGNFSQRVMASQALLDCVINPVVNNATGGLYILDLEEELMYDYVEFRVRPLKFAYNSEFCGITFYFFGVPLTFIFYGDMWLQQATREGRYIFRPHMLKFTGQHKTTHIRLSWYGNSGSKAIQIGRKIAREQE